MDGEALNFRIKDSIVTFLESRGYIIPTESDVYDIYVESDLDTYIDLYDKKGMVELLKSYNSFVDYITKVLSDIDEITSSIVVDITKHNYTYFKFEIAYSDYIEPSDTSINTLYTEVEYDSEIPYVRSVTYKNMKMGITQKTALERSLSSPDVEKEITHYDKVLTTLLESQSAVKVLTAANNNVIIRFNDYVVKAYTPDKSLDFDDHLNEAFVGLFGLNILRERGIFNFALVYTILTDKPCLDTKYLPDKMCNYVLYEYIEGPEIKDFVLNHTANENIEILKQIIYGLYEANIHCGFTHYDLHEGNIIIKTHPEVLSISYPSSNMNISTKYIPVIIDYGSSHIKIGNIDYGKIQVEGNVDNREFWIHDIFKILMRLYGFVSKYEYNNLVKLRDNKYNSDKVKQKYDQQIRTLDIIFMKNEYQLNLTSNYINLLLRYFTGEDMTYELYIKYRVRSQLYFAVRRTLKFEKLRFSFIKFIEYIKNLDI